MKHVWATLFGRGLNILQIIPSFLGNVANRHFLEFGCKDIAAINSPTPPHSTPPHTPTHPKTPQYSAWQLSGKNAIYLLRTDALVTTKVLLTQSSRTTKIQVSFGPWVVSWFYGFSSYYLDCKRRRYWWGTGPQIVLTACIFGSTAIFDRSSWPLSSWAASSISRRSSVLKIA